MTDFYPAKELVDIHCHIIPGVDDGSDGFESTMKMLKTAESEGITRMIATPHFKKGHHNVSPDKAAKLLEEIRELRRKSRNFFGILRELFRSFLIFVPNKYGNTSCEHFTTNSTSSWNSPR